MNIVRFNFDSIDSTNLEARRFWHHSDIREQARKARGEGNRLAWVFVAKAQEAGRGRIGRAWKSPLGGLWTTILWPLGTDAVQAQSIPLLTGLAVVDAMERGSIPPCRIKWPNDVLISGRKVCGILCELEAGNDISAVIIGIGINANFRANDLLPPVSYPVTSLWDETGTKTDLERLLAALLEELCGKLLKFETEGIAPFLPLVNARLAWANSTVTVSRSEAGDLTGILRGVDGQGRLLVECGGLRVPVLTGDVRKMVPED
jgi:BirA family biotin operon repressor/biotin-[acetyl-CoA-carboxylase] ligase